MALVGLTFIYLKSIKIRPIQQNHMGFANRLTFAIFGCFSEITLAVLMFRLRSI